MAENDILWGLVAIQAALICALVAAVASMRRALKEARRPPPLDEVMDEIPF